MTAAALDAPVGVDPDAPVARANPVSKLFVSSVVAFALLLTVDPVTAGVALGLQLLALPFTGVGALALLRRGRVLIAGALSAGAATLLLGVDSGRVIVPLGPISITEGSATSGLSIALRVLAIGLPGVVLLATTDPTDLADALAQRLRLPHRFVLSALAAMRLFGVLAQEWQALTAARRARGLGGGGVLSGLRDAAGQVFALLVLALRRATVLATTMESRGFGAVRSRTWARPSRFGAIDLVVVAGGLAVAAAATAAGLAAGTWRLLLT